MLWKSTLPKQYKAGVIEASAISIARDVDKWVPSVTTTNSNPISVAPADPVRAKKLLQALSTGCSQDNR